MDEVFILIWLGVFAYWVFVHISFSAALRRHEPDMYRKHSGWSPVKYATGYSFVDFALSGGHKKSESKKVVNSGNRLVKAHELKITIISYGIFLSSIWVALTVWFGGNK